MSDLRTEDLRECASGSKPATMDDVYMVDALLIAADEIDRQRLYIEDLQSRLDKEAEAYRVVCAENKELRARVTTLNNEDWAAFVASLDNPLPPTEDLRNLMADTDKE